MTTSAYGSLSTAEKVFYDIVWTPMLKSGETWLEGAVPFLNLPIIKQVDEAILQEVTDAIFAQFVKVVDITAIQLVGVERQAVYDQASEQLSVIADEEGSDSDAYKQAQDAALVALSKFSHLGP